MDKKNMPESVPYIAYEGTMARFERTIKRLVICLMIAIFLLGLTNLAWLYTWHNYDTVSYDQNGEGINNINTGEQGDVLNEPETEDTKEEER